MTPLAAIACGVIAFAIACWAGAAIGLVHASRRAGEDRVTFLHAVVLAVILFALAAIPRRRRP